MEKPFTIQFSFPLAHTLFAVTLKAVVELHHSEPYYVIHSFQYADKKHPSAPRSVLPRQEIKRFKKGSFASWVHRDSERESLLSLAIGKAIDSHEKENTDNKQLSH